MSATTRPLTVLIAAMGGEGGAVLMNWIVAAATAQGLSVQSTSVPGVAQRTGATTYYIELFPVLAGECNGDRPVLSLYPGVGAIDLVVASELIEVGRAMERGFVSGARTTLIGCTHRFYSVAEKMHGVDGRYDAERVLQAAPKLAKRAVLFDGRTVAAQAGSVVNAVLLGAIAASRELPLPATAFEDSIRASGKAVEMNLAGFAAGLALGQGDRVEAPAPPAAAVAAGEGFVARAAPELAAQVRDHLPARARSVALQAVARLLDYQDRRYAARYVDRVRALAGVAAAPGSEELVAETARHLALWMSYEDVIRVAQLKTRAGRMQRIRADAAAAPGQIVQVTEYLKPGLEELAAILPPWLARPLLRWGQKHRRLERLHFGIEVRSTTVTGFLRLWLVSKLRPLRRAGYRFGQEQAMIDRWLRLVTRAAQRDVTLAHEIAGCARLVRGYGDTHRRGVAHLERIVVQLIEPALRTDGDLTAVRRQIVAARDAALAEPEAAAASAA